MAEEHEAEVVVGSDPDAEPTEIVTVTSDAPVALPPVESTPLGGPAVVDVAPGVVSEIEQVQVRDDGTVERRLDRVEQPATAQRRTGPDLGPALLVILLLALAAIAAAWYFTRDTQENVPSIVGLSLDEAVQRLQDDGFKSDISSQANAATQGIVFDQRPASGASADDGSTVLVLVSTGPTTVSIPNTIGVTEAEARDRLAQGGFKVTAIEVFSDDPDGTVVAQSPAAGGKAPTGSAVRINVSKGTGLVPVPNVMGQPSADAETQITQAGLKTTVVTVPSDQPSGTVVAQNPTGGELREGSNVRLNVSAGP